MKKILLFASFLICGMASAQVINFPDVNFKNKLVSLSSNPTTSGLYAKDVNGQYIAVDANADGEISQSEALQVYELRVRQSSITSFAGVEYFTNLRVLDCSINSLTALNLTGLVNLVELNAYLCGGISSLDLSGSLFLETLNCNSNNLAVLDVSMLTNLKELDCSNNELTTLDLNANTHLTTLSFFANDLESIYIKNGQNENIDPAGWIENQLQFVCCDDSQIAEITAEEYFSSDIQINSDCSTTLSAPGLEKDNVLEVYPNPVRDLVKIDASVIINSVCLYDIQGRQLQVISSGETTASIDLTGRTAGIYFLKITTDKGIKVEKLIKE